MRKMRLLTTFVGMILLGFSTLVALPRNTPAQDTLEDRVSALETEVAEQDERIAQLEEKIAPADANGNPTQAATSPEGDNGGVITLTGIGTTVSDKVVLAAGRYKVTATIEVEGDFEGFIVIAYVEDEEHYLFNELIDESGTWTGSTILQADGGGETFVEVSNTESVWTLFFEPF